VVLLDTDAPAAEGLDQLGDAVGRRVVDEPVEAGRGTGGRVLLQARHDEGAAAGDGNRDGEETLQLHAPEPGEVRDRRVVRDQHGVESGRVRRRPQPVDARVDRRVLGRARHSRTSVP
jgi:hypothetical protein